ncbi:MAG: aminopeptidase [candidate division NC10 bacterium]|nr:aminopeptidase [candidate division NC10 bacterium]MBI4412943.1 aminopeptidase [candidate division NC10 bacterium]
MHLTHMAPTARMIIETLLKVQPGEQVCLLTDTECPRSITEAIAAMAAGAGAEVHVLIITPRPVGSVEPTPVVRAAFAAADVIINQSSFAVVHTAGLRQAVARDARMLDMWGFTEDMMVRGGVTVDYPKMSAVSRRLAEALSRGKTARLTTPDGTDLTMSLDGREAFVLAGYADRKGTFTALPDGEAGISPITGTAEGRLVKPFCIEVRGLGFVSETITVEVKGGRVVGTSGGSQAALLMETLDRAGPPAHNVAEFAIGTNDKCRLGVVVREAKKAWGTAHIGLGDSKSVGGDVQGPLHFDLIFLKPTVTVDGQVLVQDGHIAV